MSYCGKRIDLSVLTDINRTVTIQDTTLQCRRCSGADRERIVALERLVWGPLEPGSNAYFDWQYLKNPYGVALMVVVEDPAQRVLAHHAMVPVPVRLKGRKINVGFSVNAVTHPAYRRKGLSTITAEFLAEEAEKAGFDCIISLPNRMSQGLFESKMGFTPLGKPWLMVRWLDPGVFLAEHGLGKVGRTVSAIIKCASNAGWKTRKNRLPVRRLTSLSGLAIEKIWERAEFITAADPEWLKWRYLDHPTRRYEFALAGEPNAPEALIIYQILEPYKKAMVMEFFAGSQVTNETIQWITGHVSEKCREAGCSSLWCLSTPRSRKAKMLRRNSFWLVRGNLFEKPLLVLRRSKNLFEDIHLTNMDISFGSLINYE